MIDKKEITLHCSKIGDWLDCSWRQLFEPRDNKQVSVSSIIGTQSHRLLAGEAQAESPEGDAVIRYDKHTPSRLDIAQQAIDIARDIDAFISSKGWTVIARELPLGTQFEGENGDIITLKGRIDAVVRDKDGKIIIVDYKTGSSVNDVALQLASYLILWDRYMPDEKAAGGAWVWRQRGANFGVKDGFMSTKQLNQLSTFIVDAAHNATNPAPNPRSNSCYYCRVEDCLAAAGRRELCH